MSMSPAAKASGLNDIPLLKWFSSLNGMLQTPLGKDAGMRSPSKTMALWALLIVLAVLFFQMYEKQANQMVRDFNYPKFLQAVNKEQVVKDSVIFHTATSEIEGQLTDAGQKVFGGKHFKFSGNTGDKGFDLLREKGITPSYVSSDNSFMASMLLNWLPLVIIIAMFMFFMRQIQVGGGKAMAFGKSRARLLTENKNRVTFKDVAGVEEAKQELREIVEFFVIPRNSPNWEGAFPRCFAGRASGHW